MPRTLITVDRDSNEPLYRQLRKAIVGDIAAGTLDIHSPLPSSRQLADELGLSRNTINAAYQELIAEGLIDAHPRRGLFINPDIKALTERARPDQQRSSHSCIDQPRSMSKPAPHGFDWSARLGPAPVTGLPHVRKPVDWHRMPFPFVVGQVDVTTFPTRAWSRALRDALLPEHAHASLSDAVSADDSLLTSVLCQHVLPTRGISATPDQILITMGSQHALHLLAAALLRPGGHAGMEEPGYLDARQIFTRAGARIVPLPVDGSGIVPPTDHEEREGNASSEGSTGLGKLDLLYLTPSHHHPTNVTLSMPRRHQILADLAASDTVVIEDDYDSELRYAGSPAPALKSLDTTGRVVYLGTFTKFLAPGLRMGFMVGSPELIERLRERRRYELRHPPGQMQRALALLIGSGEYQRIVRQYRLRMRRQWEEVTEAVATHLPWQEPGPAGGGSLWMTGPENLDCRRLQAAALSRGVVVERGDIFFAAQQPPLNHFRLGFGAIPLERIEPGVRRLARITEQLLSAKGA